MYYFFGEIAYWLINLKYRLIYPNTIIEYKVKIAPYSILGGYNKFSHHSYFSEKIGFASYIGDYSSVLGDIGKYCSIASHVTFLTKTHPINDFIKFLLDLQWWNKGEK